MSVRVRAGTLRTVLRLRARFACGTKHQAELKGLLRRGWHYNGGQVPPDTRKSGHWIEVFQ